MSNQPPVRGGAAAPSNATSSNNNSSSNNNNNNNNNNNSSNNSSNNNNNNNNNNNTSAAQKDASSYRLPSNVCISHAMKLAIVEDKPIMMDYWTASLDKSVIIGVSENKDKLLVKSEDEYTSTIAKIYKVETEYIIMTENSIYIVSNDIPTKRIN
jgi:hypothetical protein